MFGIRLVVTCCVGLGVIGAPGRTSLAAQQPLNLGFERLSFEGPRRPWGWSAASFAPGGSWSLDSGTVRSGRYALRMTLSGDEDPGEASLGLSHWISPRFAWGRRIEVAGWVHSELDGAVVVTVSAIGWNGEWSADSVVITGRTGDWTHRAVELAVDSTAHSVLISLAARGRGTVWMDDLRLRADGRDVREVPVARTPTSAELDWLAARSAPLATVDATGPGAAPSFDDLGALARIVGDARIVALGESTHGTSEFFRLKHRVTEYLIREHGFRVFAIEANQLAVEHINAYVHGADDDPRRVVGMMFAVWNTEEVLAFVEWMRSYNAANPDRTVEFVGYDMQDPSLPIDSVRAFLARRGSPLAAVADSLYRDYREAWRRGAYPQGADSVRRRWLDHAETMFGLIDAEGGRWRAVAGDDRERAQVDWVVQNANVVRQAALSAWTQALPERDSSMAVNIQWILDRRPPGTRMVVWAHNAHVGRGADPMSGFFSGRSMGVKLDEMYGDDYRVFGLLTHDGSYSGTAGFFSREYIENEAYPAPVGSVAEALHRIAGRRPGLGLITDLRDADQDPNGRWLHEARPMRFVGYASVDFGFEAIISHADVFDAILFVDRTSASRLLRRGN